jgi:hypothetical protein
MNGTSAKAILIGVSGTSVLQGGEDVSHSEARSFALSLSSRPMHDIDRKAAAIRLMVDILYAEGYRDCLEVLAGLIGVDLSACGMKDGD